MQEERYCQCSPGCRIPYGYCHDGCGRKTTIAAKTNRKQGQIKGRPNLWYPGHQNKRKGPEYLVDAETGCWLWQGKLDRNGYGEMNVDFETKLRPTEATTRKTTRPAHRVFYEEAKGPIPKGMELDHLCHTNVSYCPGGLKCLHRRCVRVDHLEPVPHGENIRRGQNTKLSVEIAREIKAEPRTYGYRVRLARRFNVPVATIAEVLNGRSWKDV